MYHARLPSEYVFSIIQEPGQEMSICIIPKFCSDEMFRNIATNYDTSVLELEPMWRTSWFRQLYNNYLETSSESIFTSNMSNRKMQDMKTILENAGLVYDFELELCELDSKDLQMCHGVSYKAPSCKI